MARQKENPLNWITFSGISSYEALNSLWLWLSAGEVRLKTVSVLEDRSSKAGNDRLASRLQAILEAWPAKVPVEIVRVECDLMSPPEFGLALSGLLDSAAGRGEKIIVDLSARLPSHIPVLSARMADKYADTLLLYLHHEDPSFREKPLALIPRSAHQLFTLREAAPQPWSFSDRASAASSPDTAPRAWDMNSRGLMLLVNAFLDLGYDRNLHLRLPLLKDLPLCRLHFGKNEVMVTDFIQQKEYKNKLRQLTKSLSPAARRQLPDYNQLVQLCHASGVLRPIGLPRLFDELRTMGSRPLDEGGDVYHIALDTNLLRDRFFSTCLSTLCLSPNIDFVLCETVRAELVNRQEKIDNDLLNEMAPLGRDLAGELFFNQNTLEDRLRYIGLLEFNRMRAATGCHEQDAGSARSSARNDRYILDAYSSFVGVGCKVLFLSRDQETVRMMRGEEGVVTLLIEHHEVPGGKFNIDWNVFTDWLYLLAVTYGRLEWLVGGTPMAATDGVWAGKTVTQWEEDHVRLELIRPRSSQDMEDYRGLIGSIQRDYLILKKLSAL